ncbi:MAG: insulinase family protein [Planctomycetota bacterium]
MPVARDQCDFVLPHGLRVVLVERPLGQGFTACLSVGAGSHNDPVGKMGLAHLTEHLAFSGEARELAQQLTEQFVYVNAQTSGRRTSYYVSGHSDFLEDSLRLMAAVLQPQEVSPEACVHERVIVHQEMVDGESNFAGGRSSAYRKISDSMAGDPHWRASYQQRTMSVQRLTHDAVNRFRADQYFPANAALAIVGPWRTHELRRSVEQRLGAIAGARIPGEESDPVLSRLGAVPDITFHFDRWASTWVAVFNAADDARVATRVAADVLSHHLGGGPHSELYGRFRVAEPMAYRATSDYESWPTRVLITSFVTVAKESATDAMTFIARRTRQIADEGVSDEQFERVIRRIRRAWEMQIDDHYRYAEHLSREALRPAGSSIVDAHPDSETFAEVTASKRPIDEALRRLVDPGNRKVFVGGRIGPFARRRLRAALSGLAGPNRPSA